MATGPKLAVLYQAIEPPVIGGMRKPMKPGGYRDSGADIAYTLKKRGVQLITPKAHPDPSNDNDWCFADDEHGIQQAVSQGADHIWANTTLFASHPLQTSSALASHLDLKVIGQPPNLVDWYDDKNYVNSLLRSIGTFRLPQSWIITATTNLGNLRLPLPVIAKPIRGRGSYGVKLCHSVAELERHTQLLLADDHSIMLEEYLSGVEGTLTIMPPSRSNPGYTSLPFVERFNHASGIAPYNGVVAVTQNSRALYDADLGPSHRKVMRDCERIAEVLKTTAPIRIDVRQVNPGEEAEFAVFDVNMKPNMTGPGRPGRDDQASLTAMAAAELGWDYGTLLLRILESARPLKQIREIDGPHPV